MRTSDLFLPLSDYLTSMYSDLIKAQLQAQQLQDGYVAHMEAHGNSVPIPGFADRMQVDSLSVTTYFKIVHPPFGLWERVLIYWSIRSAYPEGIFLCSATKQEATLSLNITLNAATGKQIEQATPDMDATSNYYVLTKTT